jgi:hypothetical protein
MRVVCPPIIKGAHLDCEWCLDPVDEDYIEVSRRIFCDEECARAYRHDQLGEPHASGAI